MKENTVRENTIIEHRGFGLGHVLLALLGGAAAGAAVALLTAPRSGAESRRRIRELADDTQDSVTRLPAAVRKASIAAREAFNQALDESSS